MDCVQEDLFIEDILTRKKIEEELPSGGQEVEIESVRKNTGIVYILKLQEGKYYIGWTQHLQNRIEQHWEGIGAMWTQKYPSVAVLFVTTGSVEKEGYIASRCRQRWGAENVRGGPWRGD